MKYNIERDTCDGRGFGQPDSFMENLVRWLIAPTETVPVSKTSGGAGWHIIDDQRSLDTNPYIVFSNHEYNNGTVSGVGDDPNRFDEPHKILKVLVPTATAGRVNFYWYTGYKAETHEAYGTVCYGYLPTNDDDPFGYDFRGGPESLTISTNIGSWAIFHLNEWEGDLRFVEGPAVAAKIAGALTSYNGATWVQFESTAIASNFSLDKYYFIYDFDGTAVADYQKVIEVDYANAKIKFAQIRGNFKIGSVVTAYTHRMYAYLSHPYVQYSNLMSIFRLNFGVYADWNSASYTVPPYAGGVFPRDSVKFVGGELAFPGFLIGKVNPSQEGKRIAHRPYFTIAANAQSQSGHYNNDYMNRVYGPVKNIFVTSTSGLSQMTVGRVIDGKDYLFLLTISVSWGYGNFAYLVPNYNENT